MDGGFEIFLVLMFIFWILEGIAKARQRPRPPGQPGGFPTEERSPEERRASYETRVPSGPEVPGEQRVPTARRIPADRGQRPPSILEVLAAELQRAKESQRQAGDASRPDRSAPGEGQMTVRRAPAGPESSVSAPPPRKAQLAPQHARTAPRRAPARGTAKHAQPPRRPSGGLGSASTPPARFATKSKKPDPVLRGERADVPEQFAERGHEELTSDRWASGEREADRSESREAERGGALETYHAAALEVGRMASHEVAAPGRLGGVQRAGIKESERPLGAELRRAPKARASVLAPHSLIGASPAELRRILILQEVLGPPVGLRD